jgi:hypothetical protein
VVNYTQSTSMNGSWDFWENLWFFHPELVEG